jgi:D-alanyl-D-alanine carboxypeptidase
MVEYTCDYTEILKTGQVLTAQNIWQNTNKLLDKGYEGLKTGITDSAGPCLASSLRKRKTGVPNIKEVNIVVVVLNSKSME